MSLGKRIRELRKGQHLTQEQLAKQVCTAKNNISRYELELSAPNHDTLRLLALTLHTTVDYLVGVPGAPISSKTYTSPALNRLLATTADFSEKETEKLLEYAELLKKGRE